MPLENHLPPTITLVVDVNRIGKYNTGIPIRAAGPERIGTYDIGELDRYSLHCWLRSRGGENLWAENVVLILLEHKPVIEKEQMG